MLNDILEALRTRRKPSQEPYFVPGLWNDITTSGKIQVCPFDFYSERIERIKTSPSEPLIVGKGADGWSRRAIVYNIFPRVSLAFPHAGDGNLRVEPSADGWRDTGTLLKAIALLPYIHELGFNTILLLPITRIGSDGRKGSLGSPYAIRDPYRLDNHLAEPAVGLDVESLFKGFVEAAHHLGIRVVLEFVLRTAAKDSDWIREHPEWFYWIKDSIPDRAPGSDDQNAYGAPVFDTNTLESLTSKVNSGERRQLPLPLSNYRGMFTAPPKKENVQMIDGRWIGVLEDGAQVRVPGAFSDWPPNDNQPPWTDVTYFRLFHHDDFNYMAYNTLRMYEAELAKPQNAVRPLWDAILGIVPYYIQNYEIDGVMLDMGHALPMGIKEEMLSKSRNEKEDFAFWEENFEISQDSRDQGYDAVMGYMVFDMHSPDKLKNFLSWLCSEPLPIPFYAAAENHNTPRAASRENGIIFSNYTLPFSIATQGIPFVHSGFELGETHPINTGLGFTDRMLQSYPSEKLPLFNAWAFDWEVMKNLVLDIKDAIGIRKKYEELLICNDPKTWRMGKSDNSNLLVFSRYNEDAMLIFVANTDMWNHQHGQVSIEDIEYSLKSICSKVEMQNSTFSIRFSVDLTPGNVKIFASSGISVGADSRGGFTTH
jgi:glycosidase